ncbi:hypothetical protein A1356_19160 [Methylomonas koyamae]|uniref:Uncharacterized protein n=1 Tax=Methylomonas koyamae TaxID=702114 RepID=A0AA91I4M7_9GAMM|nr:hypothetical protein A1356_19160 [Methylomonas koyamae]
MVRKIIIVACAINNFYLFVHKKRTIHNLNGKSVRRKPAGVQPDENRFTERLLMKIFSPRRAEADRRSAILESIYRVPPNDVFGTLEE